MDGLFHGKSENKMDDLGVPPLPPFMKTSISVFLHGGVHQWSYPSSMVDGQSGIDIDSGKSCSLYNIEYI